MTFTLLDVLTQKIVVSLAVISYLLHIWVIFYATKNTLELLTCFGFNICFCFFMYHPGVTIYMQGNQDKRRLRAKSYS